MQPPLFLDYQRHPFLFPSSRLQLVPSSGFFGFTSATFQGKRAWNFETFFRPFLRIHRATPTRTVSEPDLCTLINGDLRLRVITHSPETLRIEIDAPGEEELFLGPAGDQQNFGGVLEQTFLIFDGFSRRQSQEGSAIVACVHGSAAVFYAPDHQAEALDSGFRIRLRPGLNHFSLAAGYETDLDSLKNRARQAAAADPDALLQANAQKWRQVLAPVETLAHPRFRAQARQAVWTIEASTLPAEGQLKRPYLAACKTAYTNGMWLWDTCFAIRGYARFNPRLCKAWLCSFMDHQLPDGFLPGCIKPAQVASLTQVPLFSWAANAVFEHTRDRAFLEQACRAAVRNHDAWMAQGDPECGNLPATAPISYDNSPLYDPFRIESMTSDKRLVLPDIIAALYIDAEEIQNMARILGQPELESEMSRRRDFLRETAHRHLYDEKDGFYYAAQGRRKVKIKTGPALSAIVFAPDAAAERLATYLRPGSPAWPVHGIATILADQPSYDPGNFWRGPIWGATNRLIIDALERRGFHAQAQALREETLALIAGTPDFCEVYNPETGEGSRGTLMTGFGAGLLLDLLG